MNASNKNIKVRKSADRGHANHGWLDSYHSFSFANYYDPAYMGYSVLRVINEDIVAPAQGFGMHGHRDMEIVTYMLQGALRHQDSMGNGSVIRAGDVQRMSAGTGVKHSEFNASNDEPAHLLQIWLLPEKDGITPSYEEKGFDTASKTNQWRLLASHDAREGSLLIHQDLALFATILEAGHQLDYTPVAGRSVYVHVARGDVTLNGVALAQGDAVAVDNEATIAITSQTEAEILLFDLPPAANYSNQ
ncbi:quercetin 2,3-dioxygenase [mine drainage metagenome]|uniref:Quercetin 2,3-dioxygenase n=1 Tax=mine drainage metagenome TaxID=410659 RepID=A0A1J5SEC9_9ZZZZ